MNLFRRRRGAEPTLSEPAAEAGMNAPLEATLGTTVAADAATTIDEAELAAVMAASVARTRGGAFRRLSGVFRRSGVDEELWEELEEILIGADVGVRTATTLIEAVRDAARFVRAREAEEVRDLLRTAMIDLLQPPAAPGGLWGAGANSLPPPHVVLVVGVNGAGKTTSIAKLAHAYREDGRSVILGAADTFRAAAIDQLQIWGERVGAPVIAHTVGADPGAVAFDTVGAAVARGIDVAIIDTAGRLQTKRNLMAELGKVRRVVGKQLPEAPHEVLLVLDATTGMNGLSQARVFGEATKITGICLAKLDGTSKGGVVFAVAGELGLPVRFVGTGEGAGDLAPFNAAVFVDALLAEE